MSTPHACGPAPPCRCKPGCEMPCWQRTGVGGACPDCGCPPQAVALSGRIAEARARKGYTLAGVAEALGVHRRTLERWEAGAITPSRAKLRVLALLLDVPEGEFL